MDLGWGKFDVRKSSLGVLERRGPGNESGSVDVSVLDEEIRDTVGRNCQAVVALSTQSS